MCIEMVILLVLAYLEAKGFSSLAGDCCICDEVPLYHCKFVLIRISSLCKSPAEQIIMYTKFHLNLPSKSLISGH